ncbi:MAG TPA: 3'-5' exonuclease [Microvirga sp.]|jgi:DNA polymerase-3 subunit epsilon|nr:3'-5' exonuclease [Microvirga sp.]
MADEEIARALEATGNFRVLRRIRPTLSFCEPPSGERTFVGVVLDVETTGLDTATAEVIELGMIKFEYGRDGTVFRVTGTFSQLRQPSAPIPPEITRLTGISDADVQGRLIAVEDIEAFVAGAGIVIAHNAKFDLPICERHWPLFQEMNWACSMEQIPWRDEALDAQKLGYILSQYGLFHTGHRASDDCHALLHILALPLKVSGRPALAALLESPRQSTIRLWAKDAPFDCKDILKGRGYRWSDGSDGSPKGWYIDLPETSASVEEAFLKQEIFASEAIRLPTQKLTAKDHFARR